MASWLNSIWSWISIRSEVPNIEEGVSTDDVLVSCLFDPTMEIKYLNGIVTNVLDTNKYLINNKYHFQPKTDKEIRDFSYMEINSPVRIALYRKKNTNETWKIASCCICSDIPSHLPSNIIEHESVGDNFNDNFNDNKVAVPVYENNTTNEDDFITVEVMGEIPKVINFEEESTVQILFRNNSYVEKQELLDYHIMQKNDLQLSIVHKPKLPITMEVLSHYIFDINIKGKYIGKSTEMVNFIFKDVTYKVVIKINVIDKRIIIPYNTGTYTRKNIDIKRLFELQNEQKISGVYFHKSVQFPSVILGKWNIPSDLTNCYLAENEKIDMKKIKENIEKIYPATFESLTYKNYRAKFHTLLFMEEIETLASLQKFSRERIHFERAGEYLVLKIPDLSEQRPSLIYGDRVAVTDPPNCTKRLGEPGIYEGIIHKVLADQIWLKFSPEFHSLCGYWDYSVNFFNSRTMFRKLHDMVNETWKKNKLGETFLFPYKDNLEYQPSKLKILSLNDNTDNIVANYEDNLNKEKTTLVPQPKIIQKMRWFNEKLNPEQKNAVINIVKGEGRPMPYIIFGPPGTGKTVTLTESIIQVYKQFPKSKLLICAPTNSAVDLLLSKLINTGLFDKTILKRLVGYNYFVSSSYNMDYDEYCVFPELESEMNFSRTESTGDSNFIKKNDLLKLQIVLCTEGTAGLMYMMGIKSGAFTHIFIDEAGQSMEPEILLPLWFLDSFKDGQVILAGDPMQLGPVVFSQLAKDSGLGLSMMARLINNPLYHKNTDIFTEYNGYNPKMITHLIRNYRSLPEIVENYNVLFYKSLLVATKLGNNVQERISLNNLNENTHWDIGCKGPVVVHGVMGEEIQEPSNPSRFNPQEAFQVLLYVTRLLKAGIPADDIGVITPYSSQVVKINELLKMYHPDSMLPKVGTVEMFQGQERLIIIISMVRSQSSSDNLNDLKRKFNFLNSKERTNVALSRAKMLVIIIGDPLTMFNNNQWKYILLKSVKNNNYVGCSIPENVIKTINHSLPTEKY